VPGTYRRAQKVPGTYRRAPAWHLPKGPWHLPKGPRQVTCMRFWIAVQTDNDTRLNPGVPSSPHPAFGNPLPRARRARERGRG
jgi:hypothetical protein